jgi:hypothetical protein
MENTPMRTAERRGAPEDDMHDANSVRADGYPPGDGAALRWPVDGEVAHVRWPEESARRDQLARAGTARLLHVEQGVDPPIVVDELEDWIRCPADAMEVAIRATTLSERVRRSLGDLRIDDDDVLRAGRHWVALPPTEAALARVLIAHRGHPVESAEIPALAETRGALVGSDVRVTTTRLRRRLAPLGIRITHVRGQGLLLDAPRS